MRFSTHVALFGDLFQAYFHYIFFDFHFVSLFFYVFSWLSMGSFHGFAMATRSFLGSVARWLAVKAHHEVRQRAGIVAFRLEGPFLGGKPRKSMEKPRDFYVFRGRCHGESL